MCNVDLSFSNIQYNFPFVGAAPNVWFYHGYLCQFYHNAIVIKFWYVMYGNVWVEYILELLLQE